MVYVAQVALLEQSAKQVFQTLIGLGRPENKGMLGIGENGRSQGYEWYNLGKTLLHFRDVHGGSIEYREAYDGSSLELRLQGTTTNTVDLLFEQKILSYKIPTTASARFLVQKDQDSSLVLVHFENGYGLRYTNCTAICPLDTKTKETIDILYKALEDIYQTMGEKHKVGREKGEEGMSFEDDTEELIAKGRYPLSGPICLN
jgi:hypothetical protein